MKEQSPTLQQLSQIIATPTTMAKRDVALAIVAEFKASLERGVNLSILQDKIEKVFARLETLQGSQQDRSHYAKSLCQIATTIRRRGWPDVACALLERAVARSVADAYLFAEIARCQVDKGELLLAEQTLRRAGTMGLSGKAIYTTLINGYGRAGNVKRAQFIFDEADRESALNEFAVTALIDAYGKAGDLVGAQRTFEFGHDRHLLTPGSYTALLDSLARAGRIAEARLIFEDARSGGNLDKRAYGALVNAYAKIGDLTKAEELFAEAAGADLADDRMAASVICGYVDVGGFLAAWSLLESATIQPIVGQFSFDVMFDACWRRGYFVQARKVMERAAARGFATARMRGRLSR